MDTDHKAFGHRLAAALDHLGVEPTNPSRKRWLHKALGVTERQADNYLKGVKLPTTAGLIDLAKRLKVSYEWLALGTGPMCPLVLTSEEIEILMALSQDDRDRLFQIGRVLGRSSEDPALAA